MNSGLIAARIRDQLISLKLARMAESLEGITEEVSRGQGSYLEFLDKLLAVEAAARAERNLVVKTSLAHFPVRKTLDQFDFSFQPSIDKKRIKDLASCRYIANGENVVLLGPPGVGKSHLAIGLGMEAIAQGFSVYFISMGDLVDQLAKDRLDHRLAERLRALCHPRLLVLDEFGYFALDKDTAAFLYQLVSRRYEKGAMILTSNLSYGEWGKVLGDDVLAAAILDRLLHHATTVTIKGESYRLKEKRKAGLFPNINSNA